MKRKIFSIGAVVFAACLLAGRAHANYQDDVDQAVAIIESFQKIPEQAIPTAVLRNARGLAILTVTKAGFIVSGRGGKCIVIARTGTISTSNPDGTSPRHSSRPSRMRRKSSCFSASRPKKRWRSSPVSGVCV